MHVNARTLGALTVVYLAWGGTYPAIRVMVETVPPLMGTGARFLVAGAVMAVALAVSGRLRADCGSVAGAALVGTVILGAIGVLAVAEQEVPAGLAALIIASVPLWVVALQLAHRQRVTRRTALAVGIGLAGMVLLVSPGGEAPLLWLLVLVGAAAVEAAGQFYSQRTRLPDDPLVSTTIQLLAAGAALVLAGAALGELGEAHAGGFSHDSVLAFAYLVIPGSLVAYSAFVWLLRNAPVGTVATYAYVNPVVAVVVGAVLLGERITAAMVAGGALILSSVALVVRPLPPAPGPRRPRRSWRARPARRRSPRARRSAA
jgi:drug/metabolite transporter (DMT)-like permease